MFTGIVANIVSIHEFSNTYNDIAVLKIVIYDDIFIKDIKKGDSIAVNGICLTVISILGLVITFEIMEETLKRTTIGLFKKFDRVNLEKALEKNDRLDGHIVTGHIDGVGEIIKIEEQNDKSNNFFFKIYNVSNFSNVWLVNKGSICINGVSLTIAENYKTEFMVSLIPYTFKNTTFNKLKKGNLVNLEFDILTKGKIKKNSSLNIGMNIISPQHAMDLAIDLGKNGRLTTPPNPWVGCIIEKNGKLIGWGYHKKAGEDHAEIEAIKMAKENNFSLNDAILYSTLEPCSHDGLTPPCCDTIIQEKIKTVYSSVKDPDSRVSGNGYKLLKQNNIDVIHGLLEGKAEESLYPYLVCRRHNRPYIILKIASSIDGKIASHDWYSKWISCEECRDRVHHLRNESQAILIGLNTAIQDNPKLNVRIDSTIINKPLRIVLDTYGKLNKTNYFLFDKEIGPTLIFTSSECSEETLKLWDNNEISYKIIEKNDITNKLNIKAVLNELSRLGIIQLLIEGGGEIFSEFFMEDLWDKIINFQAPCFIGNNGISLFPYNLGENKKKTIKLESSRTLGLCVENIYIKELKK